MTTESNTPDFWKDKYLKLESEYSELKTEHSELKGKLEELELLVAGLRKQVYGRLTEKMPSVSDELKKQEDKQAKKKRKEEGQRKKKENAEKRSKLPKEEVHHEKSPDELVCPKCAGINFRELPPEETTQFHYVPARVIRKVNIQHKYACSCGECIITADGPLKPWDGCGYTEDFIAQIIVAKCVDSLPLHRQVQMFQRQDFHVARATLVFLFHRCAEVLKPIFDALLKYISSQELVQADETWLNTQKKETGYLWTFLSGDSIAYVFKLSRGGETPLEVLGGGEGTLVVDGYIGYKAITDTKGWNRSGCLAHARRKFFEALDSSKEAQHALDLILKVYQVEHDAKAVGILGSEQHKEMRQTRSRNIMEELKTWMASFEGQLRPTEPLAKAITYATNQWAHLTAFIEDPKLPLDNNAAERALRIAALGRKNFLFVGSEMAGQNLAMLYSLTMTCKAVGVDPRKYMADVLIRSQHHPQDRIDELLPHRWKDLFAPSPPD